MSNYIIEDISVICTDGHPLALSVYTPKTTTKGAIMIAPATGIKRQFYASFATWLAEQGYGVVTYDNRGIGESLLGHVKNSDASLQCWGEKDMPAVFSKLKSLFPETKYHLVGHSAGGQLIGLMPEARELSSIFNYACSSGQMRNMDWLYRCKARFFMDVFVPLSNAMFGFTNSQWVGMGEPLPRRAATQWRVWCNGQGYIKTDFGKSVTRHYYDELKVPSLWVNADDDDIAIDANVADMISVFKQLPAQTLTLTAVEYNLPEIGHMKFFSRKSKVLWQHTLDWLSAH